jgi:hypothetical protein
MAFKVDTAFPIRVAVSSAAVAIVADDTAATADKRKQCVVRVSFVGCIVETIPEWKSPACRCLLDSENPGAWHPTKR